MFESKSWEEWSVKRYIFLWRYLITDGLLKYSLALSAVPTYMRKCFTKIYLLEQWEHGHIAISRQRKTELQVAGNDFDQDLSAKFYRILEYLTINFIALTEKLTIKFKLNITW